MPELARFYNIIIRMYYDDNQRHHKPHVHAVYNEFKASIGIDGELLDGTLPNKQLRLVSAWLVLHEDELYEAWNQVIRGNPIGKIPPLA